MRPHLPCGISRNFPRSWPPGYGSRPPLAKRRVTVRPPRCCAPRGCGTSPARLRGMTTSRPSVHAAYASASVPRQRRRPASAVVGVWRCGHAAHSGQHQFVPHCVTPHAGCATHNPQHRPIHTSTNGPRSQTPRVNRSPNAAPPPPFFLHAAPVNIATTGPSGMEAAGSLDLTNLRSHTQHQAQQ